jgi:hypothetical protein
VGRSVIDLALRCYPSWWTERYGEEMRAVIDDLESEGRSRRSIATGLFRDALRSRLQARGMPRTYGLLATRTKTSVAAGTLPWMLIVPFITIVTGGLDLHSSSGLVQVGYPFQLTGFQTRVVSEPGMHWVRPTISAATRIIGLSTVAMSVMYLVTLVALIIGLNAFRNGIVREKRHNRRSMYLLTWLPAATVFTLIGLYVASKMLMDGSHPHQTPTGHIVFIGGHTSVSAFMGDVGWVVAIGGWLLTMVGLAVVATRANLPPATLRFGRSVSVLTSCSLSLTFLAFITWCVAIDVQNHQARVAGQILASYPHQDLWLPMLFALGVACAASISGATSARRSWRTIYAERLWDT